MFVVNLMFCSRRSDTRQTSGSHGRHFYWTRDTDAAGLTRVVFDGYNRCVGTITFPSRFGKIILGKQQVTLSGNAWRVTQPTANYL